MLARIACSLLVGVLVAARPMPAGETFLLGGGYPGVSNLHGLIMKSTDGGKTWRETWYRDKNENTIFNIVHVKELGKIFAAGRAGILMSANGDTWTAAGIPEPLREVRDIAYGNGVLLAVGPKTNFLYSVDKGETWKSPMHDAEGKYVDAAFKAWNDKIGPVGKRHYYGVAFVDGRFVVTGSYMAAIVLEAKDGTIEFVSEIKNLDDAFKAAAGITVGADGELMIFAQYSAHHSSDGGKTWKELRKLKTENLSGGGAYGNGTWVACGGHGTLLHSADGKAWEAAKGADSRATYTRVAWGNGTFYAAQGEPTFAVSGDGKTWTGQKPAHHPDNEVDYRINFLVIRPIEQ